MASSDQPGPAPAGAGAGGHAAWSRVLLKLSGEALMGDQGYGIDPEQIAGVARVVKGATDRDVEVAVVVGAVRRGFIALLPSSMSEPHR